MTRNIDPDNKFSNTDGFMLTDLDTSESLMLIPCDTAGNFSWTGVTRAPLTRNAMQTSTTANQYSDLTPPWNSIPQESWSGGRGHALFTKDNTRYGDGKRVQTSFNSVVYNAPLEHYSEGFRNALTNCPGSLYWERLQKNRYIARAITPTSNINVRELYIHLRKRGEPQSPLRVRLYNSLSPDAALLQSHDYTVTEIDDTLAEFRKFKFSADQALTANKTYYLVVYSEKSDKDNYWEVGCQADSSGTTYASTELQSGYNPVNFDLYFRLAEYQSGTYRSKFFIYEQLMYMVRQTLTGGPTIWVNGDIGRCTGSGVNTLSDSTKSWPVNCFAGARVGIVYRKGSTVVTTAWRTIASNTANSITTVGGWDNAPRAGESVYVITDTPLWRQVTGHGLTAYVTDIEVIRDCVYFCQGETTSIRKMRWVNGAYQFKELTGLYGSFLKSVRDTEGLVLYRGRNIGINGERTIDRAVLLDWEDTDTALLNYTGTSVTEETEDDDVNNPTPASWETIGYEDGHPIYRDPNDGAVYWDSGGIIPVWTTPQTTTGTGSAPATDINTESTDAATLISDYVDFLTADYDRKCYVITIKKFKSENHTGKLSITLQESQDKKAFHDVATVVANSRGKWYIYAHCKYRYRRLKLVASGTKTHVNKIKVTTTQLLQFQDPIVLLDNYGKITKLFEYGSETYKSLWVFQEGNISSINKVDNNTGGDTYTIDRINIDELQTTAEEWNASAVNTSNVYLMFSWLNGLQRYYNTQLEGKGPDHDEGLPFDRQGRVTQIVSYPSNSFIAIDGGTNGYSTVMQFNGSGWCELYRAPNKGERIHDMAFQPVYGERPDRLWIQVGDDVIWLSMPSKVLYALQDPNAEYTHESVLVSSWHTAGMIDVVKLWQSLKIIAENLGDDCWIEADYQLDDEEIWHPIENAYLSSPSQKEDFEETRSVNGKKLRYRLRLQTKDIHKTPKITAIVIEAVGRVDIKHSYNFYFRNIKYKRNLTGEFEDVEPVDVQNLLDDWANNIKKLRLNSRWKIYDNKIVYLDAPQTSIISELTEGYIAQISLNEL